MGHVHTGPLPRTRTWNHVVGGTSEAKYVAGKFYPVTEETQAHVGPKLPKLPTFATADEWQKYADKLRQDILDKAVLRGEAKAWADSTPGVKINARVFEGGEGYSLRKLRYEALPGMWIPAILYVPYNLKGKVPVMLAVVAVVNRSQAWYEAGLTHAKP